MRAWLLGASIVLLAMTLLPQALAQEVPATLEVQVEAPEVALAPGEPTQVVVHWRYTVSNLAGALPAAAGDGPTLKVDPAPGCAEAGLPFEGPAGAAITLGPGETTDSGQLTFNVTLMPEAPGEAEAACQLGLGVASWGIVAEARARAAFVLRTPFLPSVSARLAEPEGTARPQGQVTFRIDVANLGNARSAVHFEVDPPVGDRASWYPVAPAPILLESANEGGAATARGVEFVVSAPYREGWNEGSQAFTLTLRAVSTRNPDLRGEPVHVTAVAHVRGFYCSSVETCRDIASSIAECPADRQRECDEFWAGIEAIDEKCALPECLELQEDLLRMRSEGAPALPLGLVAVALAAVAWKRRRA